MMLVEHDAGGVSVTVSRFGVELASASVVMGARTNTTHSVMLGKLVCYGVGTLSLLWYLLLLVVVDSAPAATYSCALVVSIVIVCVHVILYVTTSGCIEMGYVLFTSRFNYPTASCYGIVDVSCIWKLRSFTPTIHT